MGPNIFLRSRRRLTFFYALIMFVFTALLIGAVHQSMKWAISSEQARELTETATDMAYAQSFLLQHKELMVADNSTFKNSSDKLFYYVYDEGQHEYGSKRETGADSFHSLQPDRIHNKSGQ